MTGTDNRPTAARRTIGQIALVVRDYDEAIRYFVDRLGFSLQEDTALGEGKRWVVVAPRTGACCCDGLWLIADAAESG